MGDDQPQRLAVAALLSYVPRVAFTAPINALLTADGRQYPDLLDRARVEAERTAVFETGGSNRLGNRDNNSALCTAVQNLSYSSSHGSAVLQRSVPQSLLVRRVRGG